MGFFKEIRRYLHPHFVGNLLLGCMFFIVKTTPPICSHLFEDCQLEMREMELLTFLGCIIVLKNRKQPSVQVYIGTVCLFAKLLSGILFFRQNPLLGALYVILCLLHIAFLPEPAYKGPDYVTYFRGTALEDELARDKRITWLVEFYAPWSPVCVNFASTFAKLSSKYNLDNLKFGKLDASQYNEAAAKFRVSGSSWSKQLPTIILFQNGKEVRRRPVVDSKGAVVAKFMFNDENVIKDFNLNDVYLQCKKNPLKTRKRTDLNSQDKEESHPKSE